MDAGWLVLSEDGHYRAENKIVEKEVVYVVQTDEGQQMLSPQAFAAKYKWKNDPIRRGSTRADALAAAAAACNIAFPSIERSGGLKQRKTWLNAAAN